MASFVKTNLNHNLDCHLIKYLQRHLFMSLETLNITYILFLLGWGRGYYSRDISGPSQGLKIRGGS